MIVVYEGIDGSGKTSSSQSLSESLDRQGIASVVVRWSSFMGYKDEMEGSLFKVAHDLRKQGRLGPLAFSTWHCADFAHRWESIAMPELKNGKIVIMDRYKYTALVRDVIRGVSHEYVQNIFGFAPKPDLVVYMDVPPEVALKRKKDAGAVFGLYESGTDLFPNLSGDNGFLAFQSLCRRRYRSVLPSDVLLEINSADNREQYQDRIFRKVISLWESRRTGD